jgi:Glycosyl hydrolase catalytic core
LVIGLFLALAAPASAALTVGIGDQQPAAYAHARLRALKLPTARMIVPWDAATSQPEKVAAWLAAVQAAGMAPHVAFEHLSTDRCPGSPCVLPSRAQYRAAITAFRAKFPQVRTFTAWNEANHVSQPTATRPEAAAGYYDELKAACPACTVVAGDVLDSGSYLNWLRRFQAATPGDPQLWGLHNYSDVTYGTTSGTDAVLGAVPGVLWLEETGGIVVRCDGAGRVLLAGDEARAARAVSAAFELARTRPRIERMYVYQWRAGLTDPFDAGLLRPDGSERASYAAFAAGVRSLAPKAAASPGVTWKASWSKGRLILRLKCAVAPCRGKVTVRLRSTTRTIKLVGTRSYATKTLSWEAPCGAPLGYSSRNPILSVTW